MRFCTVVDPGHLHTSPMLKNPFQQLINQNLSLTVSPLKELRPCNRQAGFILITLAITDSALNHSEQRTGNCQQGTGKIRPFHLSQLSPWSSKYCYWGPGWSWLPQTSYKGFRERIPTRCLFSGWERMLSRSEKLSVFYINEKIAGLEIFLSFLF